MDDLREILPLLNQSYAWCQPVPVPRDGLFPYQETADGTRKYVIPQSQELRTAVEQLRNLSYTLGVRMRHFAEQWSVWVASEKAGTSSGDENNGNKNPAPEGQQTPGEKRSTERGEGRAKLIAALSKHHRYDDGSPNMNPINNNELARLAKVDKATASAFFRKQFGGHGEYKTMCRDSARLAASLKHLNGDYTPAILFGGKLPGERDREEKE